MRRGCLWLNLLMFAMMTGCGGGKQDISMLYDPVLQKVALHVKAGDVIQWDLTTGGPLTSLNFPLGVPCKTPGDLSQGKCTVSVPNANQVYGVPYFCQGCTDPEIVVGSGTGPFQYLTLPAGATTSPTAAVGMACLNSNQVTIFPTTVPISSGAVTAGATIEWTPRGIPPIGSDWQVSNFSAAFCTNGSTFNAGSPTCQLATTLTAGKSATYTVSSASCNNTNAPGTITITQ